MFDADRGEPMSVQSLLEEIRAEANLEGITLLGGEPFEQAMALAELASEARRGGLSVMTFTGYTLEALRARTTRDTAALLEATDVLVDGPFDNRSPGSAYRWLGSQNQRLHFLSNRYEDGPVFRGSNTVELRLTSAGLDVVGWAPAVLRFERGTRRGPSS